MREFGSLRGMFDGCVARLLTAGTQDRKQKEHLLACHLLTLRPTKGAVAAAAVATIDPALVTRLRRAEGRLHAKARTGARKHPPLPWSREFLENPILSHRAAEPPFPGMHLFLTWRTHLDEPRGFYAWSRWQAREITAAQNLRPIAFPLVASIDWRVREAGHLGDPATKPEVVEKAFDGRTPPKIARAALASSVSVTKERLQWLLDDPEPDVYLAALANPNAVALPEFDAALLKPGTKQVLREAEAWQETLDDLIAGTHPTSLWTDTQKKQRQTVIDSVAASRAAMRGTGRKAQQARARGYRAPRSYRT